MTVMLERWNDDKMDALDAKVDALDAKVDRLEVDLRELRMDVKSGLDRMHRLMIQFGGALIVALFVALVTPI